MTTATDETYTGVAAVAADRQTPFLKHGKVVPADASLDKALKAAGLDWGVGLAPVFADVPGRGSVPVEHRRAAFRQTDGRVFDVVGQAYVPVSNAEALGVTDGLREEGWKFVSAGQLAGGRVVWTALEAPEGLVIGGEDAFGMTLLVETSHDGKRAVRGHIAPVRFACKNVTNLIVRGAKQRFSIHHTSKAQERLREAHHAMGLVKGYEEALERDMGALLKSSMTEKALDNFLDKLLPARPRKDKEVAAIKALAVEGPANEFGRGTAYAALNAVREYYDHGRPQRTTESAFIGAMTGVNYRTTNRALELLLNRAGGKAMA